MKRLFLLLFIMVYSGFATGRDIYVATNGAGPSPFGAWENAASNIQWAVNAGTNGDTVWISNGTYYLTNQITVNSNITICGNRGELVVVDGNSANRCFYFPSTANKVGVLSNLFITHGNTNGNGGGVYMYSGTVLDCVFLNNIGLTNGGGMYFANTGTVQRCTFIANVSSNGGGLYAVNDTLVTDCSFVTNVVGYRGGGVCLANNGIMIGCSVASNSSANRGGGVFAGSGSLIYNCNISNNIAGESGGGVALQTICIISNCVIARNRSQYNGGNCSGGGIYISSSHIRYCIIEENTSLGYGGGVGGYSGSIRNCLIRNNRAMGGAGLRRYYSTMVISSCTIVSNYASVGGGGIYDTSTETFGKYDNCIIYFNKAGAGDPGSSSNYYFHVDHVGSTFTNCCFAPELPASITTKSTNSIYADPQFVNWPGGNYHLSKGSPCVNTGVNQDWMTDAFDMDGRCRIDRFSGIVDMGCYEHIPSGTMFGIR